MATQLNRPSNPLPPPGSSASSEIAEARAAAERYRCEFVDLRDGAIEHDLFRSIPVDLMFRYNFVPLKAQNGTLEIALADPRNLNTIDELGLLLHKKLRVKVATASQIADLLKKTEQSQRVLEEVTEGFALDVVGDEDNPDETLSIDRLAAVDSDIAPVIKLVDTTIFNALERRASDIHIESRDQEVVIKYRIDGVLHYAMPPIAKDWHSTIISRIKVMSELDIAERRVPQDGRFRVRYKTRLIDFRVSIMPTIHGEDAVLRVLDKESMSEKFAKLSLDVVGFSGSDLVKFRRYIAEPYGMVLVTGPTGSGKTTTLYAALSEIKNDEDKIITIEDPGRVPAQGHHPDPRQRKEGPHVRARPALHSAPRSRQDHGRRNPRSGNRADRHQLRAHRPPGLHHRAREQRRRRARPLPQHRRGGYNFVSALNCILAQRLVRINCEHCKRPVKYPDQLYIESGLEPEEWRDVEIMEGAGCFECGGTGFRGRTAIHELLDLSDRIRELILDRRPTSEIKRLAREEGMTFLRESAVEKVRQRHHHAQRDQQGDFHRMTAFCSIIFDGHCCSDPPPEFAFEIAADGIAMSRTRPPAARSACALAAARRDPAIAGQREYPGPGRLCPGRPQADAQSGRARQAYAALILPDNCVRIAVLDFEKFPEKEEERRPLINFRLRKSVPFDIDEAALSYFPQASNKVIVASRPPKSWRITNTHSAPPACIPGSSRSPRSPAWSSCPHWLSSSRPPQPGVTHRNGGSITASSPSPELSNSRILPPRTGCRMPFRIQRTKSSPPSIRHSLT